ncbi:cation:dicarboxylase symporter family transporter [Microvirga sp. SRT01]|uniref:Cation:dicarboxylase symporter family transporter n=1 Tax=Sphingomonas longa TaxID=2778730 RepID=A0ABS2D5Y2_9SPHN|nr:MULTISPECIES: cation:dicarboxylase symporter family transporter [Alphaproteobacteria]MBM6576298.1 cation:dicarboxylase symporter family transporter [Sphingomonas sp. BT552]MBR7709344.1 cation:dicarboxylase symporter family transporter [Microvirga sp. SRT01]
MSQATRILTGLAAGLLLGMLAAALVPGAAIAATTVTQPIGAAWLHGLQMVIVPLVMGLLVTGVGAAADAARAGRIAVRAMVLFVAVLWATTVMAAVVMPLLLKAWPLPTAWSAALRSGLASAAPAGQVPGLAAFFDSVVPTNVVAAAAADAFLPLTVFTLVFAFATATLPEESRERLTGLFQAIVDAMLVIVGWVLKLAPIGIFTLAYGVGARTGTAAFGALAHYIVLVSSVGVIVLIAAYPLAWLAGGVRPGVFAKAVAPAQAVAISTQSSLASVPAMLKGSGDLGVPASTAGIVLPLAVAVFRATSPAMNLSVALYVAHLLGVQIGPAQLAAGIATAAITTMGSVSLPGTISFFASVAPVALAMGVPLEALALLVAVETVPDLFRTVGNVTMDVAVTSIVARRTPD